MCWSRYTTCVYSHRTCAGHGSACLLQKLRYIVIMPHLRTESEKLLNQTGAAAEQLSIPQIFGATDEDTDSLRIVSLYEVGRPWVLLRFLCWHERYAPPMDPDACVW